MKLTPPNLFAFVVIAGAAALHCYEQFAKNTNGPSIGWLLWSMVPYALCLVVLARSQSGIPAALGALVALLFDAVAHFDVFVNPKGSTAALALLFVPLWNSLVVAPTVMLIAWLAVRRCTSK
jgi:hypothetical protein